MSFSSSNPSLERAPESSGSSARAEIFALRPELVAGIIGRNEDVVRQMIQDDTDRSRIATEVEQALSDPALVGDPRTIERFKRLYPDFQLGQVPAMLERTAEHLRKGEKILAQKKTFFEKVKSSGGWVLEKAAAPVKYAVKHPFKTAFAAGAVVIGGAILAGLGMSGLENFYRQVGAGKIIDGTKALLPLGEIAAGNNPAIHLPGSATGPAVVLPPEVHPGM